MSTQWLGYLAATLTTVAFIPQALMSHRRKKADGISLSMYVIFVIGIFCWLLYGIQQQLGPIIVSNVITLGLAGYILHIKIRYG